jgi:multidrug resistance efflux pump
MFTRYVLPLLAAAGVAFAVFTVVQARQAEPPARPLRPPPERPEGIATIAGAGIVEARQRNIPIGAQVPGVVTRVFVREGQRVEPGEPLFEVDDRELRAELRVREAMLAARRSELEKLRAAPRPEDVPPAVAAAEGARARVAGLETQAMRTTSLFERGVGTQQEYDAARFAAAEARAALVKAEKELERLRRGTWGRDLAIAAANVDQAEAEVDRVRTEIDRLTVRALAGGQVLQVNVLPGQYAGLVFKEPLIVLGDVAELRVRVDIDEQDLPLFRPGARAVATLKGRPGVRFGLEFVRVDPYVIPKRNLTGDNAERVDTRVLQVIYALPDRRPLDVYVGQQMDVYLEASEPGGIDLGAASGEVRPFDPAGEPTRAGGTPGR